MGAGESHHPVNIKQALAEFSDSLVPSDAYFKDGHIIADEVFNLIRKHRRDVDRVLVTGGIGKRTAVTEEDDFDLVIFLNKAQPPFRNILYELKDIILKHPRCWNVSVINEITLRFKVDGKMFDLSVGVNLKGWFSDQRSWTLEYIARLPNPVKKGHLYSPSLAEYAVDFVREKTGFEHEVVRLAKYWNQNIYLDGYISGRSLIIEMVAFEACNRVDKNDIYLVMIEFLQLMGSFSRLNICPPYLRDQVPEEILCQRPLVMDPVNPYNNLAHMKHGVFDEFSSRARQSLERLRYWEECTPLCAKFILGECDDIEHPYNHRKIREVKPNNQSGGINGWEMAAGVAAIGLFLVTRR